MKISFLYLDAFSGTGGIQAFNRNFLRACHDIASDQNIQFYAYSLKDKKKDLLLYENVRKNTAEASKLRFLFRAIFMCRSMDKIVLAHINLVFPIAILLRIFAPRCEVILITHGVEAWRPLSAFKRMAIRCCTRVLAVSNFTKEKLIAIHGLQPDKISIFPNTLDPEFLRQVNEAASKFSDAYKSSPNEKIIFTLCRLSEKEKRKGYETIIRLMPKLLQMYPSGHYILAGKEEDNSEIKRLKSLVKELKIENHVTIRGYLSTEELISYYAACNVFVMPSTKEGFGIVFLEALAFGKPVIAGNLDGSKDALQNGRLGILVNPTDEVEILKALSQVFSETQEKQYADACFLKAESEKAFGFEAFKTRTKALFASHLSDEQMTHQQTAALQHPVHSI